MAKRKKHKRFDTLLKESLIISDINTEPDFSEDLLFKNLVKPEKPKRLDTLVNNSVIITDLHDESSPDCKGLKTNFSESLGQHSSSNGRNEILEEDQSEEGDSPVLSCRGTVAPKYKCNSDWEGAFLFLRNPERQPKDLVYKTAQIIHFNDIKKINFVEEIECDVHHQISSPISSPCRSSLS